MDKSTLGFGLTAAMVLGCTALAQQAPDEPRRFELTPFVGYQWVTDVNTTYGTISTNSAVTYGGIINVAVQPGVQAELFYLYSPTQSRFYSASANSTPYDVKIHYMQLGAIKSFPLRPVQPFVGGTLGAAVFSPSNATLSNGTMLQLSDAWRFAINFEAGAKVWLARQIGIRLQARLMMPLIFSSVGFYGGTGGAGVGVSAGIPLVQPELSAGLIFAP
ncbi:MAG TPA: hypothetical protein VFV14_04225 [Myxococcaceae bacterium]|nr:hypothetical protein [Myxococcaceae bacterium]